MKRRIEYHEHLSLAQDMRIDENPPPQEELLESRQGKKEGEGRNRTTMMMLSLSPSLFPHVYPYVCLDERIPPHRALEYSKQRDQSNSFCFSGLEKTRHKVRE